MPLILKPRGYSYVFLCGDMPLRRESFSVFELWDKESVLQKFAPQQDPYLLLLAQKHRLNHLKHELNCLDGKISTLSGRFLTNFQGRAKFCLKKLKDRILFKNVLLPDRVSFSEL